jgi:hypothetical protein
VLYDCWRWLVVDGRYCLVRDVGEVKQPVEQHARLYPARLALVDDVLPRAHCADAGVVKHEPRPELHVEHKGHVVLAVVGDRAGQAEGGVTNLQARTSKPSRQDCQHT